MAVATKKEKNRIRHKRQKLRNDCWLFFSKVIAVGFPIFVLLGYLTYIPVNKPIDPANTVTVTAQVTDTRCGEIFIPLGRRNRKIEFDFLKLHTDRGRFRLTGTDDRNSYTEYGNYNIIALDEAIQSGDTITITYRRYCPYLFPGKYVVALQEGDQIYRSLEVHNQKVEGRLLNYGIATAVIILLTLPFALFVLDVPEAIWRKVAKKRHEQHLAAKKAAKEAKAAEKAARQQKTAPD